MQGFLVQQWKDQDAATLARLADWLRSGQLVTREDVEEGGLPRAPAAFLKLFAGANLGKQVVRVARASWEK